MLVPIAAFSALLLVGLAVGIGRLEAKHRAWDRISTERRILAEHRRALDEREEELAQESRKLYAWEVQLIQAAESSGCPACELRRQRGKGPANW